VSSPSPKLIDLVAYTSLELVPANFSCAPPSPRLESFVVKLMDDYVVIDPNDYIGLVDIENNKLDGRVMSFIDP